MHKDQNEYVMARNFQGRYMERGACLIINQLHERESDESKRRYGSEKDEEDLILAMSKIGCENDIMVKRDLTADEIEQCVNQFRDGLVETNPDFSVIVILSHGRQNSKTGQDEVLGIDWKGVRLSRIKNSLIDGKKCPTMIGKPKLFFIQACRGDHINQTFPMADGSDVVSLTVYCRSLFYRIWNKLMEVINRFIPCFGNILVPCSRSMMDSDGDGSEDEIGGIVRDEPKPKSCPNKSWYFVHHSTIKGNPIFSK